MSGLDLSRRSSWTKRIGGIDVGQRPRGAEVLPPRPPPGVPGASGEGEEGTQAGTVAGEVARSEHKAELLASVLRVGSAGQGIPTPHPKHVRRR